MRSMLARLGMPAALIVLSIATANAKSATLDKVRSSGRFTIGYREASIPFSYLGVDQKPVGLSLDLCAAIADNVKSALKLDKLAVAYVPVNASNRIPLLQNGTIDIECGSTTKTPERSKYVAFSTTIYISQPTWLVATTSDITSAKALSGKTVTVTQGSLSLPVALKINADDKLGLNIVQAKDHGEALLMLRTNRAAAWFEEDVLLAGQRASSPNPEALRLLSDNDGSRFSDALMLPKDDPEFAALVDGVLTAKMASGDFVKLYDKWFVSPIPPRGENLHLPMSDALKAEIARAASGPKP